MGMIVVNDPLRVFLDGLVYGATIVVGSESANAINTTIQLTDFLGRDLAQRATVPFYLSNNANGDDLATAPQTSLAIGTDGVAIEEITDLSGLLTSESDGDIDLTITDTGTPTFYIVVVLANGNLAISGAITFA